MTRIPRIDPGFPVEQRSDVLRRRRREAREAAVASAQSPEVPGALRTLSLAFTTGTSIDGLPFLARRFAVGDPEPGFNPFEAITRAGIEEELDDESIDSLLASRNSLQFDIALRNLRRLRSNREELALRRVTGTAASVAAQIFDPGFIVAEAAAGAFAGPVGVAAATGSRLRRIARSTLLVGGAATALEATLTSTDPERDTSAVTFTGAVAGGFGALRLGAALRSGFRAAKIADLEALSRSIVGGAENNLTARRRLDNAIEALTPRGRAAFRETIESLTPETLARRIGDELGLDEDAVEELRNADPLVLLEDLRAASEEDFARSLVPPSDGPPPRSPDADGADGPAPTGDAGKRFDDFLEPTVRDLRPGKTEAIISFFSGGARLARSRLKSVRETASVLGQSMIRRTDGGGFTRQRSGDEFREELLNRELFGYVPVRDRTLRDFVRRTAEAEGAAFDRGVAERAFFSRVGRAVVRPRGFDADPAVNEAVDFFRTRFAGLLRQAKRHGINTFTDENPNFLPLSFTRQRVLSARRVHGDDGVTKLLVEGITRRFDIEESAANSMARGILRILTRRPDFDFEVSSALSSSRLDELVELIRRELASAPDDELENAVGSVRALLKGESSPGARSFERRRIFDDVTIRVETGAVDANGNPLTLGFEDLIETNAEILFVRHVNGLAGRIAEKTTLDALGKHFGEDVLTFNDLARVLTREFDDTAGELAGREAARLRSEFEAELDLISMNLDFMAGRPLNPNSAADSFVRTSNSILTGLLGGGFVFTQLAETGAGIGEVGVRSALRAIAGLPESLKRIVLGTAPPEELRDMQALAGATRPLRVGRISDRFDPTDDLAAAERGEIEAGARRFARTILTATGFVPAMQAQREWVTRAALDRLARIAKSGRSISDKRLADLGLDRETWERVARTLRDDPAVTTARGALGIPVPTVDFDALADQQAGAALLGALARFSRNAILETSIGSKRRWMTRPAARIFLQFRNFVFQATETLLARNVRMADAQAAGVFAFSIASAAVTTAAQQQLRSIGRPDREEFLEKNASLSAITRTTIRRLGFVSFAPDIIDAALQAAGERRLFDNRNSGIGSGFSEIVLGSPFEAVTNRVVDAVGGFAGDVLRGDNPINRRFLRKVAGVAPAQRALVIEQLLEQIINLAPEEQPR